MGAELSLHLPAAVARTVPRAFASGTTASRGGLVVLVHAGSAWRLQRPEPAGRLLVVGSVVSSTVWLARPGPLRKVVYLALPVT